MVPRGLTIRLFSSRHAGVAVQIRRLEGGKEPEISKLVSPNRLRRSWMQLLIRAPAESHTIRMELQADSQSKNNHFTEICSGSEASSYSSLKDFESLEFRLERHKAEKTREGWEIVFVPGPSIITQRIGYFWREMRIVGGYD